MSYDWSPKYQDWFTAIPALLGFFVGSFSGAVAEMSYLWVIGWTLGAGILGWSFRFYQVNFQKDNGDN